MAKSRLKSRPKSRLIVDQSTKEERFIILEDYKSSLSCFKWDWELVYFINKGYKIGYIFNS